MRYLLPSLLVTAALLLAGCGNKGPLYLPQDDTETADPSTPAAKD